MEDAAGAPRGAVTSFDENVWKLAERTGEAERHFNEVQHQYRAMASGWLLAVLAGVQFVLTDWAELPVPGSLLLAGIGLGGAIGLTQLWNLDLRVYHQLLEAHFVEGLRLERDHPWLPQARTRMLRTQSPGQGVLARVVWFYLAGIAAALGIALAGLVLAVLDAGLGAGAAAATGATGLMGILLWGHGIRTGTRSPLLEAWLEEQGPT